MERSTPSTAVLEQQRHTNSSFTRTAVHENGSVTDEFARTAGPPAAPAPPAPGSALQISTLHDAAGKIPSTPDEDRKPICWV